MPLNTMCLKSDSLNGLWAPGGQGLNLLHLLILAHSSGPSHLSQYVRGAVIGVGGASSL